MGYPVSAGSGGLLFDSVTGAWVGVQGADGKEYLIAGTLNGPASVAPVAVTLAGVATNSNAAAGNTGEIIEATVAIGSAIGLTTGTGANVTSISLTAGDWDVQGTVDFNIAPTTNIVQMRQGVSLVSATLAAQTGGSGLDTDPTNNAFFFSFAPGAVPLSYSTPVVRVSLAVTTTVYLVELATFTVSTLAAFGTLRARRVR